MKRKDRSGFTLIELIVIIAVMSILTGVVFYSINLLGYADTVKCANRIDNGLSSLRLNTMSRTGEYVMYLYRYDGSYYICTVNGDSGAAELENPVLNEETGTKVGSSRVTISVCGQDGGYKELEAGSPVSFRYYKNSGAFKSDWKEIKITGGGKTSTVKMALMTGKHYVE